MSCQGGRKKRSIRLKGFENYFFDTDINISSVVVHCVTV